MTEKKTTKKKAKKTSTKKKATKASAKKAANKGAEETTSIEVDTEVKQEATSADAGQSAPASTADEKKVASVEPVSTPEVEQKPALTVYTIPQAVVEDKQLVPASKQEIALSEIDADALWVVRRLRSKGFEAYLTGGCVRDLLLGVCPKDFDVATSAKPEEVKQIFRNCRLIGRRFRLAHVVFGENKIIETATFRAHPAAENDEAEAAQEEIQEASNDETDDFDVVDTVEDSGDTDDIMLERDNAFGSIEEDAMRRDLTINGLFYDPIAGEVIDFVGGREDLKKGLIRTIGDPDIRFREDPVRILRAIKFATRLGMQFEKATENAMSEHAELLLKCAPARLHEEIIRLLTSGHGAAAFKMMEQFGIVNTLLPELLEGLDWEKPTEHTKENAPAAEEQKEEDVSASEDDENKSDTQTSESSDESESNEPSVQVVLQHQYYEPQERRDMLEKILGVLDEVVAYDTVIPPSVLWTLLVWPTAASMEASGESSSTWFWEISEEWMRRFRLTRRCRETVKYLLRNMPSMLAGVGVDNTRGIIGRSWFKDALLALTVLSQAQEIDFKNVLMWKAYARQHKKPYRQSRKVSDVREPRRRRAKEEVAESSPSAA